MEYKRPLIEMGDRIRSIRKKNAKLNQVSFYRVLFPEKDLQDENIKKKMNKIENGKIKEIDFDLLLRLHEKYDVSVDYLLGYETEYTDYENKAASLYTGLSSGAIKQLHSWKKDRQIDNNKISTGSNDEIKELIYKRNQRNEADRMLKIINRLLEPCDDNRKSSGLNVLFDIYMMSISPSDTVLGIPEELAKSNLSLIDRAASAIRISADSLSFSDGSGGIRNIDIGAISRQIWKEQLVNDIECFLSDVGEQK